MAQKRVRVFFYKVARLPIDEIKTDGDALVKTFSRYSDTLSSDGPLTMKDEDKTPVPPKKKAKHIKEEPILVEDPADVKLKSYKRSTKKKSKS